MALLKSDFFAIPSGEGFRGRDVFSRRVLRVLAGGRPRAAKICDERDQMEIGDDRDGAPPSSFGTVGEHRYRHAAKISNRRHRTPCSSAIFKNV
mmetsp:Transcript_38261/g.88997  ORF Transcript_38261/g.88997 Transcript_38261/m.88997 type:complete len:94 (-) Transcript_38261:56-337(-)